MNVKAKRKRGVVHWFWPAVLLLYVCFIYSNSMKPAAVSSQESGFVLKKVCALLAAAGVEAGGVTDHLVRKSAHFLEYALLGALLVKNRELCRWQRAVKNCAAAMAGFLIPFLDETIQLFVTGRSGQIGDVWLDLWGAAFGAAVSAACLNARRRRRGKRDEASDHFAV